MKDIKFNIDYTYCPKGHGDWIFMPSCLLYPDVFWCEKCDCFYEPVVKPIKRGVINKSFNSDREKEIIDMARFIKWRDSLSPKDMPPPQKHRGEFISLI